MAFVGTTVLIYGMEDDESDSSDSDTCYRGSIPGRA